MSGNIIKLNQELIHTELKGLVKNSVEETLNAMLDSSQDPQQFGETQKNI